MTQCQTTMSFGKWGFFSCLWTMQTKTRFSPNLRIHWQFCAVELTVLAQVESPPMEIHCNALSVVNSESWLHTNFHTKTQILESQQAKYKEHFALLCEALQFMETGTEVLGMLPSKVAVWKPKSVVTLRQDCVACFVIDNAFLCYLQDPRQPKRIFSIAITLYRWVPQSQHIQCYI